MQKIKSNKNITQVYDPDSFVINVIPDF